MSILQQNATFHKGETIVFQHNSFIIHHFHLLFFPNAVPSPPMQNLFRAYQIRLFKPSILLFFSIIICLFTFYLSIFSLFWERPNFITYGFLANKFIFTFTTFGIAAAFCYLSSKTYPIIASILLVFYILSAVILPYLSTYIKDTYGPEEHQLKSQAKNLLISNIETPELIVALTFDDGPTPGKTEALLDVLKKENVHATFFVVGKNLKNNEAIVRRAFNEGHEIGNHTYSHVVTRFADTDKIDWEYTHTSALIEEITGEAPKYCRPPTGKCNMFYIRRMNEKYGLKPVLWTNTTDDWRNPDDDTCYRNVLKEMPYGGAIFLHHDFASSPQLIERLIHDLRTRGYRFVTISELLEYQEE